MVNYKWDVCFKLHSGVEFWTQCRMEILTNNWIHLKEFIYTEVHSVVVLQVVDD